MCIERKFSRELRFTEAYKKYHHEHIAIREAMCLKAQYPGFLRGIKEEDLFVGRLDLPAVGFSPDEWGPTSFGYYCIENRIIEEIKNPSIDDDYRNALKEMLFFWKEENTSSKLRAAYPERMAKALPTDDWMHQSGISFPLYRLCGANVNFNKLIKLGIPGMYHEIESYKAAAVEAGKDINYYEGSKIALDVLVDTCKHFANEATLLVNKANSNKHKQELMDIANVLVNITQSKPKHLREAIQLFWIYSLVADVRNYGRMDVYLGDLYVNDVRSGIITEEVALSYLVSLWRLIAARDTRVHGRVIIGGKGRPNEESADAFALLAMEATRLVKEVEPQLTLRFYKGMNPALMSKALDVIGEGRTFPMLYNDDVNIGAVENAFGFNRSEAEQYVPYGCGEYILEHKSFGSPSGVINLLKALEITIHNGKDLFTGKMMGLSLGEFENFKTFDQLWEAYKKQVKFYVELMADQEELEYKIAGESAPFLYTSMLYDGCLESGNGMFSGGIKYLGGTLETYGNTNIADSFTAIKELLYDKGVVDHKELLAALDANFVGYEELRKLMLDAPKYGNDIDTADQMLVNVHNHICNLVRDQKNRTNLYSYLAVIINNSANTLMGHQTCASADGRKSGETMANGNAPTGGMDKNGVTALFNSSTKPNPKIHAGAVQNMKFSRELFTTKRKELEALLYTYFQKGGTQAMITVVNRQDLENAMINPEKYQHIFVRVGGFSARFVELGKDVQGDILSRTLY